MSAPSRSDPRDGSHDGRRQPEPGDELDAGTDEEVAPPVVVVMVTHDPGDWFEETLDSVGAQTYPNLSVLVIDAASDDDVEGRIAAVLPEAHLRRLDHDPGFGAAANQALEVVEGAAFYLFCHDDVRLDPDAARLMVQEAFRSNAGVVGPKIVDWHHPDHLLQVGMGADKTGVPAALVERGELDQEQSDAVRDVYYVPGAATLVRADLFETIGGFDPGIDYHADDLVLGWLAHLAGARVLVAPAARVAHLEALGVRRPVDDRRRLQMRHRLRAVLTCYGRAHRLRVVPQAAVLAVVEVVYALLLGRFRHARDVAGAWPWTLRRRRELRERRALVRQFRVIKDRDVRRLQVRGSARLTGFLRGQLGGDEDRLASMAASGRDLASSLRSGRVLWGVLAWTGLLVVWLLGSRHLLFGSIPEVREFAPLPSSAVGLLQQFASGYRDAGLGSGAPAPTAFGFVGLLGLLFLGATSLLRSVLILGLVPLGALGMWRLCRPIGSRRSRVVGLVVYGTVPVAFDALGGGSWTGLVMYAAAPWLLAQLARASRLAPFGTKGGVAGPGVPDRPVLHRVVGLALVTALAAMLVPAVLVVVLAMALVLLVAGLLTGQLVSGLRTVAVAVVAVALAFVLHLPWSASYVSGDWTAVLGAQSLGARAVDLSDIVRFGTGSEAPAALGWAVLVVAALALLIGRQWRLAWAVRGWFCALAGWAVVWASSLGWLPGRLPGAEVVLAPAAAGIALACALGMAAFEVDLPDYHFGWRQLAAVLAGVALVVSVLPILGRAVNGSWGLPDGDFATSLSYLETQSGEAPMRTLWMGDASVLPLRGWRFAPSGFDDTGDGSLTAFGTTSTGLPEMPNLYPGSAGGATSQLEDALVTASFGGTTRLGSLLAPMGIRYVVVPDRPAPAPYVERPTAPSPRLVAVLDSQLDLSRQDAAPGVLVYRNAAWGPARAQLPGASRVPAEAGADPATRTIPDLAGAPVAVGGTDRYAHFSGDVPQSQLYLSAAEGDRWELTVDGQVQPRSPALGWASSYRIERSGTATLTYLTSPWRYLMLAGQALLWVLAIVYLLRTRVERDERRSLAAPPAPPAPEPEPDGHHPRRRRRHREVPVPDLVEEVTSDLPVVPAGDRAGRRSRRQAVGTP